MEKRLGNCSKIKAILMVLVILYHSIVFWTGEWWDTDPKYQSEVLGLIATWLNSFHIYAFTMVSGYVFAYKIYIGGYKSYFPFLLGKTKRLIIPYYFVMSIWVVPISIYLFHWPWDEVFRKWVLCIDPSQLWFLWMLFWVFVVAWPCRQIMINKPVIGWIGSLFLYFIGIVGRKIAPNIFCIWSACQFAIFFFVGVRLFTRDIQKSKIVSVVQKYWYVWILADLLLFYLSLQVNKIDHQIIGVLFESGLQFTLHVVGAMMLWAVLQKIYSAYHKYGKFLKTITKYSMPMYLFHQQLIYFTIIWFDGIVLPGVHAIINFIFASIGALLLSVILEKWGITRTLIGYKKDKRKVSTDG